jgi:pimeloyl-ACP methyl ester carboxylesterase
MLIFLVPISIVVFLGALCIAFAYAASGEGLNPPRQPIAKTPKEYGLDYEDIEFKSTDGINLKGWLIPGKPNLQNERVVIIAHAMGFNRHGWSARRWYQSLWRQPEVDFLPLARVVNQRGYTVLMFDLGSHGESDMRRVFAGGLNEYQDIAGAVDYVGHRYREDPPRIGIIAACAGANSTIVAMSKARERMGNVAFLVLLQPISPPVLMRCFMMDVYTPPSLLLLPLVETLCRWRGGYSLQEMSPQKYARDINVPTLHVQAKADPWTTLSDVRSIYEAIAGPKELWLIEGKLRRFDTYTYVSRQPERVLDFAEKHFSHEVGR